MPASPHFLKSFSKDGTFQMCGFQSQYKFTPQLLEMAWHLTLPIKHSHQNYSEGHIKHKDTCCVKIPLIIRSLDASGSVLPSHSKQNTPLVKQSFKAHVFRQDTQISSSKNSKEKYFPSGGFFCLYYKTTDILAKGKLVHFYANATVKWERQELITIRHLESLP